MPTGELKDRSLDDLAKELDALESARVGHRRTQTEVVETQRLLHELRIHQVELEMQNRELREAQGMLEESRARYVDLYDWAPVGFLTFDRRGTIEEINLTGASLIGRERARLIGHRLQTFLVGDGAAALDAHLYRCLKEEIRTSVELTFKEPRGRIVELVSEPNRDAAGAVISCHSAMTDITERKHAELERARLLASEQQARAAAERASRFREDFLAVVSHELRTPLAPMLMWMGVLRSAGADADLRARALSTLELCLKAQVDQIDDLVDLARGTNGKLRIEARPMSLQPLVEDGIAAMALSASAKGIHIVSEMDGLGCRIAGDPARLRQVVANLLSNAIKFTPSDGHVVVRLFTQGREAVLSVEDDGEGIDPASLVEIFEPFRQQDSTRARRHDGLGLGLAIVRQLVVLHGGMVRAESAGKDQGAKITVTLPLIQGSAVDVSSPVTGVAAPGAADAAALRGMNVLVIEDQQSTRDALTLLLRRAGAGVTPAASAAQGRAALAAVRPDLILCDISMPDEDGHTFIGNLRLGESFRNSQRIPAVALTAHASSEDQRRALDAGFDLHVAKPIDPDMLVSILARWREAGDRR
jgi:PAS domain S-box-containing protein